jgi:DNA processing protein
LIKQGAKCVQSVADILEELPAWRTESITDGTEEVAATVSLDAKEQAILQHLSTEPTQISVLMELLAGKITISDLHTSLLSLEIKGCIEQLSGAHYIKKG